MITMQVNGRLGNQMFQYSFARMLWERTDRRGKIRLEFISYGEFLNVFNTGYEKIPSDYCKAPLWKWRFHLSKGVLFAVALELAAARVWRFLAKLFRRRTEDNLFYEHKWERDFGWIWSLCGVYIARYGHVDFRYPKYMRFLPLRAYGCFECSRYFNAIKPILQTPSISALRNTSLMR